METIAARYKFSLSDPITSIPKNALEVILHGGNESFSLASKSLGVTRKYKIDYEGIANFILHQYQAAMNISGGRRIHGPRALLRVSRSTAKPRGP